LQHFRGRRLLLQRLAQIVGALAQFVEQPRVLDGDDGLRSKVLHQLDLLVGERADVLAINTECTNWLVNCGDHRPEGKRANYPEVVPYG
jgi:hypothetical protein